MQAATFRTDPGGRSVPFDMIQHGLDGDVMTLRVSLVAGQRPQHTDRLRRRERRVEPGDRPDHLSVGQGAIDEWVTEHDTGHGS